MVAGPDCTKSILLYLYSNLSSKFNSSLVPGFSTVEIQIDISVGSGLEDTSHPHQSLHTTLPFRHCEQYLTLDAVQFQKMQEVFFLCWLGHD